MSSGRIGEDAACRHLIGLGHEILERNWKGGHLEIDIISKDADGVHFVEVKSVTAPYDVSPEEKVGRVKRKRVTAAALKYLHGRSFGGEVFFDVVTVVIGEDGPEVKWYPKNWKF